jgi:H+/Cl- antiporter ClcA
MPPMGIRYLNILLVSTCLIELSAPWYAIAFVSNSNSNSNSNSRNSRNNNVLLKPFTSSLVVPSFSPQSHNRKLFVLRNKNGDDDENNKNNNDTDEYDKTEISQTTTITAAAAAAAAATTKDKKNEISSDGKDWNTSLFPAKNFLPPPPLLEEIESGDKNVKSNRLRTRNFIKQLSSKKKKKRIDVDMYDENRFRTQLKIQGLAVMVGLLSGVAVSLFKMGIEGVRELCYTGGFVLDVPLVSYIPVFAITTLGGIAVAIFTALGAFPPGVRGEIDEVDDASLSFFDDIHYDDGTNDNNDTLEKKMKRFDPLYAFAFVRKAFASIFTLGTGCSLGPEGPSVEVAMAMSRVCMFLWPPETTNVNGVIIDENGDIVDDDDGIDGSYKYSKENVEARVRRNRLLLSCGAAAGVSAGFNAPLAGVFFALEVVQAALPSLTVPTVPSMPAIASSTKLIELRQESLSTEPSSITAILIASVVSGLVARILLGNELALALTTYEIKTPLLELPLYLMLGALSGLVAVAFSQSAKLTKSVFDGECGPAPVKTAFGSLPRFARPVIGALTCGIVGSFYPQVLFFGYDTLNGLLGNNSIPTITLLILLAAKIFTTAVAAGSGLVGGVFAPSLFLGGMCGASFHNIVQLLFTSFDVTAVGGIWALSDVPAYAMVGAASTLAALFRAPLTASLLLFELTRSYDILIPLLASAGVGSLVSDIVESKIEARNYKK